MITTCHLCRAESLHPMFRTRNRRDEEPEPIEQHYCRCKNCGLIQLRPLLSAELLARRYSNAGLVAGADHEVAFEAAREEISLLRTRERPSRHRYWRLAASIYDAELGTVRPGRILDIGCGIGAELLQLDKKGWDIYGTDLNTVAIAALNEFFPEHFRIAVDPPGDWAHRFDVVMMNQVLEHLVSPRDMLELISKLLSNTGRLIVVTPNAASWARLLFRSAWVQYWPPEHVALVWTYANHEVARRFRLARASAFGPTRRRAPTMRSVRGNGFTFRLNLAPGRKRCGSRLSWASTFLGPRVRIGRRGTPGRP